jgi:glycosyltransferase involved in cell wall biosynthesis
MKPDASAVRIALVGNWPPPYGGLAVHVAGLAGVLRDRGFDVQVLDVGEGDHRGPAVRPARGGIRFAAALADAVAEGRLVHVHTNGANRKSWLVALAGGRARRPGAPRGVLTIHSGLCPAYLAAGAGRRAIARAACAGYARIVAVNGGIAAALAAAGVARARIAVLPPFSPALLGPREPPEVLGPFRAAHAPLFAAALAHGAVYGADALLPAFGAVRSLLPRAGLVVFGPGTAGAGFAGEGILGLGLVSHGAALAAIEAADVFVRPTLADGDALSVREALALGRAVVATAAGHRPPGCLLVRPDDRAALAAGMLEAAAAPPVPAARPDGPDPFDALAATYAALAASRPLPDGGRDAVRASTF